MSVTGFVQTKYIINENQRSLISGQALYYNSYFQCFDEIDYSIIFNQHTEFYYLYVSNDLYESVMFLPDFLIDIFSDIVQGNLSTDLRITGMNTTVDWLVNNKWHYASDLPLEIQLKEIDGVQYTILSSDYVKSEIEESSLFKVFDVHFTKEEIGKIFSRLLHVSDLEFKNVPTNKILHQ